MAKLPSSSDVPQVSPRVMQDPGVSATPGAFQSPLATAAEEFSPVIEQQRKIILQQENRRDTVDRATSINQYNLDADDELRRINVESDLSREDVLQEYGKFLADRRNQFLTDHGGSEDSQANLNLRLMDIESRAIGQAGALSTRLGREKVSTTYNDALSPIIQSAAVDPTTENIDQQFINTETLLGDLSGAFDPSQEQSLRVAAREQVALSAIDSLLTSGRAEVASSMFENRLFAEMTPESQRTVRRRIQGVRAAKDEFDQEISAIEAQLGRPLTEPELLSKAGISTATQKLSEGDKRRQRLINRGYSEEFADDVESGSVRVMGPDQFGQFTRVNSVTGESTPVTAEDSEIIANEVEITQQTQEQPQAAEQEESAQQQVRQPLEAAVMAGTGPQAVIRTGLSNFFGPWIEGEIFPETASAKQKVRTFNQMAKGAMVNNPRFPKFEQELIKPLLPDVDAFFLDPDRARTQFVELKDTLNEIHDVKLNEFTKPGITTKRREELSNQMSRINEILSLMTEEALPEGVPEGSEPAGESTRGNPVFRAPDGRLFEVAP